MLGFLHLGQKLVFTCNPSLSEATACYGLIAIKNTVLQDILPKRNDKVHTNIDHSTLKRKIPRILIAIKTRQVFHETLVPPQMTFFFLFFLNFQSTATQLTNKTQRREIATLWTYPILNNVWESVSFYKILPELMVVLFSRVQKTREGQAVREMELNPYPPTIQLKRGAPVTMNHRP